MIAVIASLCLIAASGITMTLTVQAARAILYTLVSWFRTSQGTTVPRPPQEGWWWVSDWDRK